MRTRKQDGKPQRTADFDRQKHNMLSIVTVLVSLWALKLKDLKPGFSCIFLGRGKLKITFQLY